MGPFDPLKKHPHGKVQQARRRFSEPTRAARKSRGGRETLPHKEQRLRQLLETANVIPWEADGVTWHMIYVGPQATRILGYPVGDWYQPQFWETHIHPEDRDWVLRFCQDSATRKVHYELEYRMVAVDGQIVWLHDVVTVVPDAQGQPMLLQGFMFDITERRLAEEALREREQALCQAITERQQLNEDLHDSILQSLFAVGLSLQTGKQALREDPNETLRLIDRACHQLKSVMAEIRGYIAGLASDGLQGRDFKEALEALVQSFRDASSQRITLNAVRGQSASLPTQKAVHLLHVAREAISNAVRHANASKVRITLSKKGHSLRLEIKDNGRGFRETEDCNAGNGLKNIKSRVQKLHGTFNLQSTPNCGTRLLVEVPTHS